MSQAYMLQAGDYRMTQAEPAEEPVTLEMLKAHLRLSGDAENAELAVQLAAARQHCEAYVGQCFVNRNVSLFLDAWPSARQGDDWWDGVREAPVTHDCATIALPLRPVQAIAGIYVYPAEGAGVALAGNAYECDLAGGRIRLAGAAPQVGRGMNGIEIRLTAGHGAASAVPAVFKQAVRQMAAHLYSHRGDSAEQALRRCGAAELLAPYRAVGL